MKYLLLLGLLFVVPSEPAKKQNVETYIILDGKNNQESVIIGDTLYANWLEGDSCVYFEDTVTYGDHNIKRITNKSELLSLNK